MFVGLDENRKALRDVTDRFIQRHCPLARVRELGGEADPEYLAQAAELGWFVAEHGRQPWAIEGILPTFLAVSPVSASNVAISLVGFVVFYSVLAVVDAYLLVKYVRIGPTHAA